MQDIRNIAIIAHVDHGKTTIVDRMIYQARQAREQEKLGELILDNNDLERERGITILAKNVSVIYKGVKINVIDTPKSLWPGVSMTLIFTPLYNTDTFFARIVIPLSLSRSLLSRISSPSFSCSRAWRAW